MNTVKVVAAYSGGLVLGLLCAWLSLLLGLRTFLPVGLVVCAAAIVGLSIGVYKLSARSVVISWFCGVMTAGLIAVWWVMFVLVPFV
ncbi:MULTISPECIES: hypothetical protein [unclassified Corynebacterium]|uniref:hypothetical protein n=1 Tax=unclassified Corynebacterium TaxID=2624378 RepID=UPI0029CA244A|nr:MULTISPECIES: hypothetical protein [unclassified Corynebacterium]WPF66564.1 hypothetical protein OLX12_02205 [Corynebacterium sp. 22KM0430]WPF69053.1 hypothetical protein OLW90_02200 [Corynebacterium sp. 21KM1197]